MIYYLMGKSASGKDTIYKRLREAFPQWKVVTPYTTRPLREGEREGVEYHFITNEEMDEYIEKGKVIELRSYDTVLGLWRYGLLDDGQIDLKSQETDYLLIGTLEGYEGTVRYFGRSFLYPIYIEVPNEIRMERAKKREMQEETPNFPEMERRFLADEIDFSEEKLEKAGIHKRYQNIDLESCLDEIITDTRPQNK